MKDLSCNQRKDPVSRMVRNMTAKEMVEWMVEYHDLPAHSSQTVEINLREQYKWHRLQGRLDHWSFARLLASILGMYSSPMRLATPVKEQEEDLN